MGFKPIVFGFGDQCFIRLSYERKISQFYVSCVLLNQQVFCLIFDLFPILPDGCMCLLTPVA